eukprot:jgi/Bigna1/129004/aug1.8_g3712
MGATLVFSPKNPTLVVFTGAINGVSGLSYLMVEESGQLWYGMSHFWTRRSLRKRGKVIIMVPKNKRIAFEHARRLLNGEAIEGYGDEWKGVLAQKVAAEDGESRTAAKQGSKVAAEEVRSNEKSNIKGDNIKSVASSKKATGKGKKNAPKKQADRNRSHRKQDSTKKQTKDKNTVKEEELSSHADVQGESKKKSNLTKTTREEVMEQPTGEELRALIEEKMEDIFKNRRDELMEKNEFTKKGVYKESSVQREQPEVNERIQAFDDNLNFTSLHSTPPFMFVKTFNATCRNIVKEILPAFLEKYVKEDGEPDQASGDHTTHQDDDDNQKQSVQKGSALEKEVKDEKVIVKEEKDVLDAAKDEAEKSKIAKTGKENEMEVDQPTGKQLEAGNDDAESVKEDHDQEKPKRRIQPELQAKKEKKSAKLKSSPPEKQKKEAAKLLRIQAICTNYKQQIKDLDQERKEEIERTSELKNEIERLKEEVSEHMQKIKDEKKRSGDLQAFRQEKRFAYRKKESKAKVEAGSTKKRKKIPKKSAKIVMKEKQTKLKKKLEKIMKHRYSQQPPPASHAAPASDRESSRGSRPRKRQSRWGPTKDEIEKKKRTTEIEIVQRRRESQKRRREQKSDIDDLTNLDDFNFGTDFGSNAHLLQDGFRDGKEQAQIAKKEHSKTLGDKKEWCHKTAIRAFLGFEPTDIDKAYDYREIRNWRQSNPNHKEECSETEIEEEDKEFKAKMEKRRQDKKMERRRSQRDRENKERHSGKLKRQRSQ